ncbi:MAG: D-2-hydroxyacid dehydrogenase [Clostridiaceae bacterium]|jgi:glycerate dehydrogenase|nr:D-2-hydroxyacid dehydrogenase [Clostridiaceae bacterium]
MKIVVLDGYTLNPGDLSWDGLNAFGDVSIYDYTSADQIVARARGAEILFTNKTPLQAATLAQLDGLTYIGVLATGYNVVDVKAAAEHGVTVTNIPTYGTNSVAQMVFALLLELCHHVHLHSDAVLAGEWSTNRDFCFWKTPLIELQGKTIGIVGFGRIGRQVAKIADAFGMRVLAQDKFQGPAPDLADFRWAELDELLAQSDVVSLHCPLFPDTAGLISKESLARMKSSAFLINTSRGGLIVDQDLADALDQNRIAGAALDVLSVEPPPADNPLLKARNILVTPHISWATAEARARLMGIAVDNLNAYLAGKPINVIRI